ncbi:MAG: FRG domain-containing protein [Ruminococcus sp.]
MFFFFFEELHHEPIIQKAFKMTCLDKLVTDGYFDMSIFIYGRIKKSDMLEKLYAINSKFTILYSLPRPKSENALGFWKEHLYNNHAINDESNNEHDLLSNDEAVAIVNWVYKILSNSEERIEFTKQIFKNEKELHNISSNIEFQNGVFYNSKKVEINFVKSLYGFNKILSEIKNDPNKKIFYRGHANANYFLIPSIMRKKSWKENEAEMYNELIINCPDSFEKCNTHLEKLVEMQHYGLPTRLLDITRNPLVALFFATESEYNSYGEVVIISADKDKIKYPQSDTVTVLSSLPLFKYKDQKDIKTQAKKSATDDDFNDSVPRLLHEVRLEKPAFLSQIKKDQVLDSFVVYALKNNNRIVKQDGAFIICGLADNYGMLNKYKYQNKNKRVIILIDKKKKILEDLDRISINHSTLFPEIECVSDYIKNQY